MTSSLARIAALLAALALSAAACSSSDADADAASPASGDVPTASGGEDVGSPLDISAATADGSTIDLSAYAGQDLLLWFWAPW